MHLISKYILIIVLIIKYLWRIIFLFKKKIWKVCEPTYPYPTFLWKKEGWYVVWYGMELHHFVNWWHFFHDFADALFMPISSSYLLIHSGLSRLQVPGPQCHGCWTNLCWVPWCRYFLGSGPIHALTDFDIRPNPIPNTDTRDTEACLFDFDLFIFPLCDFIKKLF